MLTSLSKGLADLFDKKWLVVYFFPCLLFTGLCTLAWLSPEQVYGLIDGFRYLTIPLQAFYSLGILCGLVLLTNFVYASSAFVTRVLEGYWWGVPLEKSRRHFYKNKITKLLKEMDDLANEIGGDQGSDKTPVLNAKIEQSYFDYPPPQFAMATRLGNALRSAEVYPFKRYGIDGVVLWPRLYPLLPEGYVSTIQEARSSMDAWIVVCYLSFLLSLVAAVKCIAFYPDLMLSAMVLGGLASAYATYWGAVAAARVFGETVRTAFDLYRWPLLEAMKIKLPESQIEEVQVWKDVADKVYLAQMYGKELYSTSKPPTVATPTAWKLITGLLKSVLTPASDTLSLPSVKPKPSAKPKPPARVADKQVWVPFAVLALALVPLGMSLRLPRPKATDPMVELSLSATPELTHGYTLDKNQEVTVVCIPKSQEPPETFRHVRVMSKPTGKEQALVLRLPSSQATNLAAAAARGTVYVLANRNP